MSVVNIGQWPKSKQTPRWTLLTTSYPQWQIIGKRDSLPKIMWLVVLKGWRGRVFGLSKVKNTCGISVVNYSDFDIVFGGYHSGSAICFLSIHLYGVIQIQDECPWFPQRLRYIVSVFSSLSLFGCNEELLIDDNSLITWWQLINSNSQLSNHSHRGWIKWVPFLGHFAIRVLNLQNPIPFIGFAL
jgi:hypothetical protein